MYRVRVILKGEKARLFTLNPGVNTFVPEVESPLPGSSEIKVLSAWRRVAGAFRQGVQSWEP